eukprot:Unigene5984_Nuclearia_a/m.18332 Unigene5984_Nuclearia_a/g.18332  ORF Unigene5984_Nuclearia_a/g.18332 Unigene5984_Nuclearia_a/m.18332 type:complete len:422 (+) Unigene5984_Nuclearia_a:479-1744(+)
MFVDADPCPSRSSDLRLRTCTRSCSTAPERNVSQAAMSTRSLFCSSQKQILARLVDLPTPLTPQKTIENGRRSALAARMSRSRSVDFLGVRMRCSAGSMLSFTSALSPLNDDTFCPIRLSRTDAHRLSEISLATFLLIRCSFIAVSAGSRSARSRTFWPTRPLKKPKMLALLLLALALALAAGGPAGPASLAGCASSSPSSSAVASRSPTSYASPAPARARMLASAAWSINCSATVPAGAPSPAALLKSSALIALRVSGPSFFDSAIFLGCLTTGSSASGSLVTLVALPLPSRPFSLSLRSISSLVSSRGLVGSASGSVLGDVGSNLGDVGAGAAAAAAALPASVPLLLRLTSSNVRWRAGCCAFCCSSPRSRPNAASKSNWRSSGASLTLAANVLEKAAAHCVSSSPVYGGAMPLLYTTT